MAANYGAVAVLAEGYGMEWKAAARAVHFWLWSLWQHPSKNSQGDASHPDWCAELLDFERRTQWQPPTACQVKGLGAEAAR